jgi:G3E family GTPase
VTLFAGPSTTLRDDLVRCLVLRRPGLVAIVYSIERGGLRRRILDCRGEHDQDLLQACCLSCAVREDAGRAIAVVQGAERWREVVLALPAPVSPSDITGDLDVDTVTTVVDARLLLAHVSGDDLLAERGLAAADADRRSTAELVVRQLEDADVLAVADLHRLATGTARTVEGLLAHLAPLALQVPLGPGGTGCDDVVSTGRRAADASVAQREQLAALAVELCAPTCDVATIRWESDRPLHSGRLAAALPQLIDGVVRSRGHVWLADRPAHRLRWESAGGSLSIGDPLRWAGPRGLLVAAHRRRAGRRECACCARWLCV